MTLSAIIPTYKRSYDLRRLLQSMSKQTCAPIEVIVVIGPDDEASHIEAEIWQSKISSLRIINSEKASVVYAMNKALSLAKGDVFAFLDDDTEVSPDWSKKIIKAFSNDETLGAYGGRDYLHLDEPRFRNLQLAKVVGKFRWDGIIEGNHHCGSVVSPVQVDVLKGVNLSFRRKAFAPMKIETELESFGAETCWEIDICQQVSLSGYKVVYDNENYVQHYVGERTGNDNRVDVFSPAWPKRIYNHVLISAKFRPATEWIGLAIRSILIGSKVQPGFAYSVLLIPKYGLSVLKLPWKNISIVRNAISRGLKIRKEIEKS